MTIVIVKLRLLTQAGLNIDRQSRDLSITPTGRGLKGHDHINQAYLAGLWRHVDVSVHTPSGRS